MSKVMQGGVLYINALPAAHAGPGGHACAQEECWVTVGGQKVKQVFTNTAHAEDLKGTTTRIFLNGYPLATKSSFTSKSVGDGSSEGGVKTGTLEGKASFLTSSKNVTLEGAKAIRHGDVVISNAGNTELTTWVQPTTASPAIAEIVSDPVEVLPNPKALNIQLIRNPAFEFSPPSIQQSFSVTHTLSGHKTCETFGGFKNLESTYLWHADYLREGTYQVHEFYPHIKGVMQIPLGKIKTVEKNDLNPGMKLVPLFFRRYDDFQGSADQSKLAYENSYIYLFKDGYLWRVFRINREERLYEMDLSLKNKNLGIPTSAELTQGILLPIEDADGEHKFAVAVSPLPWSWEYIYLLGGINPNDRRFLPEHQLGISPDLELIKKRLQPITIHELVNQGEKCSIIPTNKTQDEILRGIHVCEPPKENSEWIIDRDKFNHSTGTQQFDNDLYWHTESPPKITYTPTLDRVMKASKNHSPVPGAAIALLHDPLGRLIFTSELMVNRHAEHVIYLEETTPQYTIATLAGQFIDSATARGQDPEDYRKRVHENKRLECIKEYEYKIESYKSFMREAIELLKFWFIASHEYSQWEDFRHHPDSKLELSLTLEMYTKITQNIWAAFMISPEGLAYLKEEVKQTNSKLLAEAERIKIWSNSIVVGQVFESLGEVLAAVLEPGSQSFEKLMNYVEGVSGHKFSAAMSTVPMSELIDFSQSRSPEKQMTPSAEVLIKNGVVTKIKPTALITSPGKMLTILTIENTPFFELYALTPNSNLSSARKAAVTVHAISLKVNNSASFKAGLAILAVFNTNTMLQQIEQYDVQGDLDPGSYGILHAEVLRNCLLISELAVETGLMTKTISKGTAKRWAIRGAAVLSVAGIIVGMYIDFTSFNIYRNTGEYGLVAGYSAGLLSSVCLMIGTILGFLEIPGAGIYAMAALGLFLISLGLIYVFTKDEIEQWLFDCFWGKTKDQKDTPEVSIEKFHLMVTFVNILEFNRADNIKRSPKELLGLGLAMKIKPYDFRDVDHHLYWKLQAPKDADVHIKVEVITHLTRTPEVIHKPEVELNQTEVSNKGAVWEMRLPRRCLADTGIIGKVRFECYDIKSGVLLGKDAYELHYSENINPYSIKKVLYGPIQ